MLCGSLSETQAGMGSQRPMSNQLDLPGKTGASKNYRKSNSFSNELSANREQPLFSRVRYLLINSSRSSQILPQTGPGGRCSLNVLDTCSIPVQAAGRYWGKLRGKPIHPVQIADCGLPKILMLMEIATKCKCNWRIEERSKWFKL